MTSVRVLSTTELGAIRYDDAVLSHRWPVEFKLSDIPTTPSSQVLTVMAICASDPSASAAATMHPVGRTEWVAVVDCPTGHISYTVMHDGREVANGGEHVAPPDAPVSTTRHASQLRSRAPPSSARQVGDGRGARGRVGGADGTGSNNDGLWPVEFRFCEETHACKAAFVEVLPPASSPTAATAAAPSPPEATKRVEMTREFGLAAFVATVPLPVGTARYRFRAALKDACQPDAAPFTRLGWDASAAPGPGLATWVQTVEVRDLRTDAEAGVSIMRHDKKVLDDSSFGDRKDIEKEDEEEELAARARKATEKTDEALYSKVDVKRYAQELESKAATKGMNESVAVPGRVVPTSVVAAERGRPEEAEGLMVVEERRSSLSSVVVKERVRELSKDAIVEASRDVSETEVEVAVERDDDESVASVWTAAAPLFGLGIVAVLVALLRGKGGGEKSDFDSTEEAGLPSAQGWGPFSAKKNHVGRESPWF